MKLTTLFTLLVLGTCSHLYADITDAYLGYVQLFGDSNTGYQQIQFFNTSGASAPGGCSAQAGFICDDINVTKWSVTVKYTDSSSAPQTGNNDWSKCCDTIQPYLAQGGPSILFSGLDYTNTIAEVVLTGAIPSSFNVYDGSNNVHFQSQTPFTVDAILGVPPTNGAFAGFDVTVKQDLNPSAPPSSVPEPGGTVELMAVSALTLGVLRRLAR